MSFAVSRKRFQILLGVAFVSLIGVSLSILAGGTPAKVCQVTDQWVNGNRTRLPSTVTGLLSLPPEYRKAVFGALTPTEKSNVFREYYREMLRENPQFNSQQKEVIQEQIAFLSPELYSQAPNLSPEMRMAEDELMRKRAELLPTELRMPFLTAPGRISYVSMMSLETHAAVQLMKFQEALHSRFTANAGAPDCDCTIDWMCFPNYCQGDVACHEASTCGPFGTSACWGVCLRL